MLSAYLGEPKSDFDMGHPHDRVGSHDVRPYHHRWSSPEVSRLSTSTTTRTAALARHHIDTEGTTKGVCDAKCEFRADLLRDTTIAIVFMLRLIDQYDIFLPISDCRACLHSLSHTHAWASALVGSSTRSCLHVRYWHGQLAANYATASHHLDSDL